jgi:general secretion pathway protein A
MYCDYYGFREPPFTLTPNPRFLFFSKNHLEAYAHLFYGITNHAGFIELTGEVGTGKTTVIRTVLNQLDNDYYRVALIVNPCLSSLELMRNINREYGIPGEGLSASELLRELDRFLLTENAAGRTVVLVIDEAQNLEPQVLEQIRLISNLETETEKLIQIVLAGQPELGALLERRELRQLSQRIPVRYHLRPMEFSEIRSYIELRLEIAGGRSNAPFTASAIKRISRFSGGVPRLINVICDRSLLVAFANGSREISESTVAEAARELKREKCGAAGWRKPLIIPAAALFLCLAVASLMYFFGRSGKQPEQKQAASQAVPAVSRSEPSAASRKVSAAIAVSAAPEAVTEAESARRAFGVISRMWGGAADGGENAKGSGGEVFRKMAAACGLGYTSQRLSLYSLRNLGIPVMLEMRISGTTGNRFAVLTAISGNRFTVSPALNGQTELTESELKSRWRGRVHFVWKDFAGISMRVYPGSSGPAVGELRRLLVKTGFLDAGGNSFDGRTTAAIRAFQKSRGLVVDGTLGVQTLLVLYRDAGEHSVPRLAGDWKGRKV